MRRIDRIPNQTLLAALILALTAVNFSEPAFPQNLCAGPWSLSNQQPISCVPYPNSLWYKPLPPDVMNHLMVNSDVIAQNTFSDAGQFSYPWPRTQAMGIISTVASDGFDPNSPLYYGQAGDPVYKIASCPRGPSSGFHYAVGMTFHAPSAAPMNFEGSDSFFADWDQTNNLLFAAYQSNSAWQKLPACPGGGHAGTLIDPCPVSFTYCGVSNWTTDPLGYQIKAGGDSLENGGWATHNRGLEMINNGINHAQYLETDCTVSNVFPAVSDTFQCANPTNKPPEGALFFFDYTASQLADIKPKVPLWQYELIQAMTVYGGYMGDTHGGPEGVVITRFEGPAAYNLVGIPYALGNWIQSFPQSSVASSPLLCINRTVGKECELGEWVSVPLETGPNCPSTACDVSKHLHIADPCVAKGLAGASGGCITVLPPAKPQGLQFR